MPGVSTLFFDTTFFLVFKFVTRHQHCFYYFFFFSIFFLFATQQTSLALSSMVTEFDRDCDDKLNEAEFRRLVRACTKKAGYRLEAEDELSLS
jgi:hypothetical protein